jgi:hypothetical protein
VVTKGTAARGKVNRLRKEMTELPNEAREEGNCSEPDKTVTESARMTARELYLEETAKNPNGGNPGHSNFRFDVPLCA